MLTSTGTSTTTRATTGISTRAITASSPRKAPRSHAVLGAAALLAVVLWTTFAFGGVYAATLGIPAVICIFLAAVYTPWAFDGQTAPALHACLAVYVAAIAGQLLPLPADVVNVLSPALRPTMSQLALALPSSLPLTIDPSATTETLLINAALVVIFLVGLRVFGAGGVRLFARGIALAGLVLALIALAQQSTANGLMYWRWKPASEGGEPFGPFVNKNHFATWAVLAIPLVIGYLAAHSAAHRPRLTTGTAPLPLRRRVVVFFDGRATLLSASISMLVVALVATLSRSGWFGLGVAAAFAAVLRTRSRRAGAAWKWLVTAAAATALLLAASASGSTIAGRLASTRVSAGDRLIIWKDTLPMVRDFWLTGTGAGTYETGMLVYQRASPGVRFNQAHNHYLQLGAEGGMLLCIPLGIALTIYVYEAWRRLAAERSGMFWIRAGALCGLAGAAAQSVWETGLTIPANAALAAVLAAIVIHEPRRP